MKMYFGLGVAVAAACLLAVSPVYAADSDDLIEENIYIGGVDVGGLDAEEALAKVSDHVDELAQTQFTLDYEGNQVTATAEDFGLTWTDRAKVSEVVGIGKTGNLIDRYKVKKDLEHENIQIDITLGVDRDAVEGVIEDKLSVYDVVPKDYGLKRENGEFIITDGSTGMKVDVDASAATVVDFIENSWDRESSGTIEMTAEITEPESRKEDLLMVKDVLGTFTTDFSSSSAGRATNVKNGASKINGTVLYPGQELSVYDLVNPMTAENGYELAGSYENGTTVQTYGGGICQVSSTLYNAAIRAEMRIEERYCHSMIVSYVQPSMDAAIAGTYKNLRFSNPYEYPVYVEGYTSGGYITFTIYGHEERPSNRVVTFESETISSITPELQVKTTNDAIGYVATLQGAHEGKTACLWKIVTVDGEEQSRDVFNRSTYNASPKIIAVGLNGSPEAVAMMQEAIATKNESTIRETAAALAASEAAQQESGEAVDDDGETSDGTSDSVKGDSGRKKADNKAAAEEITVEEEIIEDTDVFEEEPADASEEE